MSSGMPASRQRSRSASQLSGRNSSPSSRQWKSPRASPKWTVTTQFPTGRQSVRTSFGCLASPCFSGSLPGDKALAHRLATGRDFFDGLGMAFMSRHDIDFVAFDLAGERHRRPPIDDPLTELLNHRPGIVLVQVEFLGDL